MKRIGIGLIVLLVLGYLFFHALVYHQCYFPPSLFDWPDRCL